MMRNEPASVKKCEYVQMHTVQTADPGLVLWMLNGFVTDPTDSATTPVAMEQQDIRNYGTQLILAVFSYLQSPLC